MKQNLVHAGPDDGADAGGGGAGKSPRRRGSRGGRGRTKAPGAAKEVAGDAEDAVPVKARSRRAPVVRRKGPAKNAPIAEVAEQPAPAVQETIAAAPVEAPVQNAPVSDGRNMGDQQNAGQPGIAAGVPRVGMRPAVIRPAGPGRMSFSTEKTRHQFRPGQSGGGFRPPRAFAPPTPGAPGAPAGNSTAFSKGPPLDDQDIEMDNEPQPGNQLTPPAPLPQIPSGNRHQAPQQHRGGPVQGRGQPQQHRNDQRGGGGRGQQNRPPQQGGQRHGGQQQPRSQQGGRGPIQGGPRIGNPQNVPPGLQGPQGHAAGGPRQPQNIQNVQRVPQQALPRPVFQRPVVVAPPVVLPMVEQVNVNEGVGMSEGVVGNEIVQLPTQVMAAAGDAIANGSGPLQPLTPADLAALAPFAEDIEIDDSLSQMPAKRRELTGRDMLINVVEGEEVRISVVRRGQLEELYMERSSSESHIGNIYKGRVTNVEPSIQAAFIDFGIGKNGFLHISDLHPQYFPKKNQPKMPQQRGGRGPVQRAATPAAPPIGFQPPAEAQAVAGEGAVVEHAASGETAAVAFDAPQSADSVNVATENVPANETGVALETTEILPTTSAENSVGDSEDTAEDQEHTSDEQADFGSAYNSEFSEEDEDADYAGLDDGHMKPMEKVGRKTPRYDRPPIQQCLRRGQEVIVQVTKEGIGTKGPTLTSYISCPGRYLVMMPGMAQLGVSRKIEDLEQRRELKRTLQELNPPKNLGFIIRTAGTDVSKKELQGDLNYLVRMWKVIANRIRNHRAPVELYQESDLVIRTIRDVFNDDIDRIVVDNEQVASRIRDFLSIVDPRSAGIVELYTGTMPLYQKFGVEREIEKINSRRVEMANGGSLVIDSTEALVAIDVNSGRYREQRDAELTAFNMNKEAVKEVVRQLRLRDLGGVIVIDFIDMREERHKREIEGLLRKEMESDRAKTKVLRMSLFCMIEMTRQRVRPSLKRSIYQDCPHCHGSALIKTPESVSLDVMRRLAAGATRVDVSKIDVRAYPTVATFLLNRKRKQLVDLEEKSGKRITIVADGTLAGDQIVLDAQNAAGNVLNILL